jgi:hypothetical protein
MKLPPVPPVDRLKTGYGFEEATGIHRNLNKYFKSNQLAGGSSNGKKEMADNGISGDHF